MFDDFSRQELLGAVDRTVEELLSTAGAAEPPIDAIALARVHLGIEVCLDQGQRQRGRAQRSGGRRQIFLKPEPSEERHQWTVAHEIGEHLKPSLLQRLGVAPEAARAMAGESLANLLAYHLLVPTRWFHSDAADAHYDLPALKARYRTASHEVVAMRILDLPEPCVISIIDNDQVYRRKSNAWRIERHLSVPEEECQRYVHDYGRARTVQKQGWLVQGWPVHRDGWKREILRSRKDDDWAG
jgi:Zn-dependent peptidase ImmA (M78 family)